MVRKSTLPKVYELRVELEDIKPPVWRRILVPAKITLAKLHDLLQLVMGWTDSHLHLFQIGERTFSADEIDPEGPQMLNEKKYTLEAVLGDLVREFLYEYDFGDSWRHRITVKPFTKPDIDGFYPLCVDGARAAPPEDVGGVSGYEEFLSVIKNPRDAEYDSMLVWVGGAFDPEGFDLNEINRTLRFGSRPKRQTEF